MKRHLAMATAVLLHGSLGGVLLVGCKDMRSENGLPSQASALQGQLQASGSGSAISQFDSGGTLQSAVTVSASEINSDGTLKTVATARLDAQGRYTISVPSNTDNLIVQVTDSGNHVLASAVAETSGSAGKTTVVIPISTRTSVEATVLQRMVATGASLDSIDVVDLYQRIDTNTAAQLRAMAEDGADTSVEVNAMATAVISAQATVLQSYANSGVTLTGRDLFEDKLAIAQSIDATLDSGGETALQADASLAAQVDTALQAEGVSAKARALGSFTSGAAFRGVLSAQLAANASDAALIDTAARADAALEAHETSAAVMATLTAAGASQDVMTAAANAGATLQAQVAAAASATVAAQAFDSFQVAITASAQSSSVLSALITAALGADVGQVALQAILTAQTQAEAVLLASIQAVLKAAISLNFNVATTIVGAYATYSAAVTASASAALPALTNMASVSSDLIVITNGAFVVFNS